MDCRQYKRVQATVLKKPDDKNNSEEERINIAVVAQRIEDNSSLYNQSEHMKSVTTSESWVVDSSTTCHFSSFKGDFKSIKRWSAPKIVRITDGKAYNVISYRIVTVNTTHGPLELSEVWYAPVLQARLMLTSALNN